MASRPDMYNFTTLPRYTIKTLVSLSFYAVIKFCVNIETRGCIFSIIILSIRRNVVKATRWFAWGINDANLDYTIIYEAKILLIYIVMLMRLFFCRLLILYEAFYTVSFFYDAEVKHCSFDLNFNWTKKKKMQNKFRFDARLTLLSILCVNDII